MFPEVPPLDLIAERLLIIFPEGIEHRTYVTRDIAARTIFVMFYAGAIEGTSNWVRPSQITDMTDAQAAKLDEASRVEWVKVSLSRSKTRPPGTWYATNSREPIRDETIKKGFMPYRAVVERLGVATTSEKPKYALNAAFAALFDIKIAGDEWLEALEDWQKRHLSKAAISRMRLVAQGASLAKDAISVQFPNGETRALKPGPSSVIAKAVIEVFAPKFLKQPAVLWLSESGNKVVKRDEGLANSLGLNIDPSKALPDIILVDMGTEASGADLIVVFTEVVATDGPIDSERKATLKALAIDAGFDEQHLAFLTAYLDRDHKGFKRSFPDLAWGSLAWFASEPDHIIDLRGRTPKKLSQMNI